MFEGDQSGGELKSHAASDLALDIDLLEGSLPGRLEATSGLAGEYHHFALTVLKESLTAMVTYESCTLIIRLEAKFFREETKFNRRLIPVNRLVESFLGKG